MTFRTRALLVTCLAFGLGTTACSSTAEEEDSEDALQQGDDREYGFKYAFPANELFKDPITKTFDVAVEKHGLRLTARVTPTAKIAVDSPVVEGKVTVGKRRLASAILGQPVPKILDAELKATSTYRADLTVDLDLTWATTEAIDDISRDKLARDLLEELTSKLGDGKGMELATHVGEKILKLDDGEEQRSDLPLSTYHDVIVTCDIEELSGDLSGTLHTGVEGSVTARAVYNSEGVEKRHFRKDPTKKFELDKSDFKAAPPPSFQFKTVGQHVKGSCSVQPVLVVSFAKNVGVRLRVDGRSSFDTTARYTAGGASGWQLAASPEVNVWGEADITVPIVHKTIDKNALLFTKKLGDVNVDVGSL